MNWLPYLPKDLDVQVSKSQDYEACASYSAIHILEMVLMKKTGYFWEFSERALAKLSDTQPWGNSLQNVVNALNQYGVLLDEDWDALTYSDKYEDIDWAEYYAPIPEAVLKRAYRVKASFSKLSPLQATTALKEAPLWTIVKTSSGRLHCVTQISDTQFYDSYEVRIKNFSDGYPIQSQYKLTIKMTNMPNSVFVKKAGTGEFGFYLPALSEDALKDKAMNLGINILKPDGTIDYSLAKEITGL